MTDNAREYLASSGAADSGQQALIERAEHVLSKDDRVLGVWLVGSFGRGTHDRFSDVDLWVVVAADDAESFCDDWPKTSDEISPTVFRRALGPRVFNHITPDWLRFDVSVSTPDAIGSRTRSTAKPLYDPHGLSAGLAAPGAPKQPDPARVESITVEFLRVLGLLPVAIGREEYVVGQSGAGLLRQMLIDLMLEDVAVEDRGGALHLDRLLPADRQQLLASLPPLQATRDAVITANLTCATHFLPLARTLHTKCALPWPQPLEDAARQHLSTTLSIHLPT
ncbi:nucleotidyltransferase domain-containing protein [Kribbella sp. CA-245084]|uniref:nucleotidyltransferase domain-containing protein n=1 Tax=Kribbella sp. CA-245084 TaxID=3239940 RepID=UPI003D90CA21